MGDLIIDNHIIDAPMRTILNQIKKELTNGKLRQIEDKGDNFLVTCPHHKNGMEASPACYVYCGSDPNIEYGWMHCFTCDEQGPLYHFVAECFDKGDEWGKRWLLSHFGDTFVEGTLKFPSFDLLSKEDDAKPRFLNESLLDSYQSWHPYLAKRGLSRELCERFKVKYDPNGEHIVFPCWDERGNLVMCTRRSVNTKQFLIPKDVEKPVYLLNVIKRNNINEATIVESQFNCLTLWQWGIPSCALFGTGTTHQYDILNKSDIKHYYLCFDGDDAGDKGIKRFLNNIRKDVFVDIIIMTRGKDVNDLSEEEFNQLPIMDKSEWLRRNNNEQKQKNHNP